MGNGARFATSVIVARAEIPWIVGESFTGETMTVVLLSGALVTPPSTRGIEKVVVFVLPPPIWLGTGRKRIWRIAAVAASLVPVKMLLVPALLKLPRLMGAPLLSLSTCITTH